LNRSFFLFFRAFDANKDDLLTFREWQVGFYLLLLLPSDKNTDVSKEDFLLALEIIFRLYDENGDSLVSKKEIEQISTIITQPEFAARFNSGVLSIVRDVDTVDLDKYVCYGAVTQEEFLKIFSRHLKEH